MNLVELIINKIPNNLTDFEKARFIYLELGKLLEFDTTTMNNSNAKTYINKFNNEINIENLTSNKVNCHNWSDIYAKLLNKVGIVAEKQSQNHAWVIIKINNQFIYADAILGAGNDLANIKSNRATEGFFPVIFNQNNMPIRTQNIQFDDDLKMTDNKFNYNKKCKNTYDLILSIKNELKNKNSLIEKVDYIFDNVDFKGMGFFEGNDYIKYLMNFCIGNKNGISASTLSRTLNNGDVESIKCITITENTNTEYYIFSSKNGIEKIKQSDLKLLNKMGFGNEYGNSIKFIKEYKIYEPKKVIEKFRIFKENAIKFIIDKTYKNKFNYSDTKIHFSNIAKYKNYSPEHGFQLSSDDIGLYMKNRLSSDQVNNIMNKINDTGFLSYETGMYLKSMINDPNTTVYTKSVHSTDLESIFNEGIRCLGNTASGMGQMPTSINDVELESSVSIQTDLPFLINDIKNNCGISQGSNPINGTIIMNVPKGIREEDMLYYNTDTNTFNIKPEYIVGFLEIKENHMVSDLKTKEDIIKKRV